ncbi:hypothetical protein [Paracidovorax avenae]|uniref:hypothetical protein n=1 Tax=Paracidovorax avenae TaxID=80867 RepID=UPI00336A541E
MTGVLPGPVLACIARVSLMARMPSMPPRPPATIAAGTAEATSTRACCRLHGTASVSATGTADIGSCTRTPAG